VDALPTEHRFQALDGLRGLACLIVLFSHFVIAFYETLLDGLSIHSHFAWDQALSHSTLILLYNPRTGVAIFFVLSGFVLASSVATHQPPWPALALRRWIRLCLPVLLLLPFCWAALHAGAFRDCQAVAAITHTNWLNHFYPPVSYWITLRLCIYNVFFTFFTGSPGAIQNLIGTIWTLPIELLGSLGLFAFYSLGADVLRRARGCFGVSALAIIVTWTTPYYGFGLGLALFETRRGISHLPPAWRQRLSRGAQPLGLAALAAGIWLGGTPFTLAGAHLWLINSATHLGIPLGINDMQQAGAVLLVAAAVLSRPFQRLLCTRVCQYLGRISFMLFLVQNPVICAAPLWVFLRAGPHYHMRALSALLVYVVVSIALADVATRFIDRPSIRLSRLATRPWRKASEERTTFCEQKVAKKLY
jgi:peptidoglycan/LPS O-acetylase OafA/YrhL